MKEYNLFRLVENESEITQKQCQVLEKHTIKAARGKFHDQMMIIMYKCILHCNTIQYGIKHLCRRSQCTILYCSYNTISAALEV